MDFVRQMPPFTRLLFAGAAATSIPVFLGMPSVTKIWFSPELIRSKYEVWRVLSTFLFAGPSIPWRGAGWLSICYVAILNRVVGAVEVDRFVTRPADLLWQAFLASSAILALNTPLGTTVHFQALLAAFSTFLWTASFRTHVDFIEGFISLPTFLITPALVLLELAIGGDPRAALPSLTGVLVGFVWGRAVLSKAPLLTAPGVLEYALPDQPNPQFFKRDDKSQQAPPRFGMRGYGDLSRQSNIRSGPKLRQTNNFRDVGTCAGGSCG